MYAQVIVCTQSTGAYRGQKRVSDIRELELQAVVSSPMWVLESKLRSSKKQAVLTCNL